MSDAPTTPYLTAPLWAAYTRTALPIILVKIGRAHV